MTNILRVPLGVPAGGQFAQHTHTDDDIDIKAVALAESAAAARAEERAKALDHLRDSVTVSFPAADSVTFRWDEMDGGFVGESVSDADGAELWSREIPDTPSEVPDFVTFVHDLEDAAEALRSFTDTASSGDFDREGNVFVWPLPEAKTFETTFPSGTRQLRATDVDNLIDGIGYALHLQANHVKHRNGEMVEIYAPASAPAGTVTYVTHNARLGTVILFANADGTEDFDRESLTPAQTENLYSTLSTMRKGD